MKLYCSQVRFGLASFASAVMVWSAAAQTNGYSGPDWSLVDAPKVLAAASDVTLAKYPNCDDATVEKKMMRVYGADGTGECQDETYTKVLTEKGRRNNRTLSLSFMLPYSTVQVVHLEVIKPDGKAVPVDVAANSKESINESQMQMNIYDPNDRILQVNIPGVEIGDLIHSVTRQTIERSYVPGQYAEETVLEEPSFILHTSYEVRAPAGRPLLRVALRDEVPGTVAYSKLAGPEGGVVHHWEIHNVPRMFDEPAMPPYEMVLQRLYVSTMPDWQTVSKWYWNLSKSHLDATSPAMKQKVDSLTAGATTEMDRVKSVFYFVSKKIRYMGLTPEKDRPGFEPHDVEMTFDKKYGVCRDKAALLVSMLREAGLNAYPVLISVGVKRDSEVPDPDFNHAIVTVQLKKGDYLLMDPTDENTRALLPTYDCDQSFLVCRPEGEGLKISPVQPPVEHLMRVVTTGTLAPDGALEAKSDLYFDGVNDDAYRNAFAHMKEDDRRRFFERNLKRSMPGARLRSLKLTPADMLDMSVSLHAELEYSVEGMTAAGHGRAIVSLPWIGKDFGVVNFILNEAGLDKRKYPMRTYVACGLAEGISLKLAGGFGQAVSLPSYTPIDDPSLSFQEHVTAGDGVLKSSRELTLKVVEFPPAQYATLKQTLKSLEYDQRKAPILAVSDTPASAAPAPDGEAALPPVQSNAQILESRKEMEVTDPHASTLKINYSKRILTYAGKKRESEIKVSYNPACQTARLTRGVVTSRTGRRQEISAGEINVMDAGWNASAKRYTGEKILVANLPGVEIGSVIEVALEITGTNLPFVSGFESFQLPDQLDRKSVALTAPAGLEIHQRVSGPAGLIQEEHSIQGGKQTFRWQAEHVQALPEEPQLPPDWVYDSGVGYFAGSMASYLKELNDTMLHRSEQRAKAAALATQLVAAHVHDKLAVVAALRDFVAKSIRLAGPSFTELPLSELSAADTTLAEGYGHAADRAILLHAMLAAAGFQPEFVLASDLPPIAGITNVALAFPLPRSFDHPLVRVTVDGTAYYLNDTDQYARLGATAFDGRLALVLSSQTSEVIHAVPGCENKMETDYTLAPDNTGRTRVSVRRRYYGANYNEKNRYFSELPPEERRRYFQEIVSGLAQGARAVGDLTTRFDDYPGLEQFTADIDNYSVVDGNYFYFDLPFTPSLMPVGADRRALPLFISRRSDSTVRTEIQLPPGFRRVVMAPGSRRLDAPDGSGKAEISSSNGAGKWAITHEFETAPAIIPPPDYTALLKVESALGRKSAKVFLLEKD